MFRFTERLLKNCGSGCQLLWSDPNKQASGYDSVRKDVDEEFAEEDNFEGTLENDPLTGAIIMAQPSASALAPLSASARAPVWSEDKLTSPIVKNTASSSAKVSNSFNKQNSSSVRYSTALIHNSALSTPIVKNAPIVKNTFSSKHTNTTSSDKRTSESDTNKTKKLSKKQKLEAVKMQIVSTG